MSINWVMVPEDLSRPFVPLPRERLLHTSPLRTAFTLKSPKPPAGSMPAAPTSTIDISITSGVAYLTTQRVVYLPRPATSTFKSFSVPLLHLSDTHVTAPFFGPNVLVGEVKPIREGGIPTPEHAPYTVELRLTFKDGGAYDFHTKFCEVRERAVQAREIVREIGENGSHQEVHGEQLPAYEDRGADRGSNRESDRSHLPTDTNPSVVAEDPQPPPFTSRAEDTTAYNSRTGPPAEPPPDYEEIARPWAST